MKIPRLTKVNRTLTLSCFFGSICFGLLLSKIFKDIDLINLFIIIPLGLVAVKKKKLWSLSFFILLGLSIGYVRGDAFYDRVVRYDSYFGRQVSVVGRVSDDPGYTVKKLTEFHITNIKIEGETLPGRVRIRSQNVNDVSRGDIVRATGVFRPTLGTSRQGSVSYATVIVEKENNSRVESIRKKFFTAVYSSLPEPHASLGIGYLLGVRTALPEDFTTALSVVGLTHIVAVSGYNLTIIVQFIKRIFSKISAYQTVLFSGILISAFLVMTGWSPSITRAAIISGLSLIAWYYGRSFKPILLILIGAAITALINPLYIWGDVGWYLSFLAFTGVLIVSPLLIYFMARNTKNIFILILFETLSAQLLTLPYISVIFGRLSIISPIANLIVVPFIPISMLLIFITGIAGMISPILALWIAIPAKILMSITVWVIQNLGSIGWAQSSLQISIFQAVVTYILLFIIIAIGWYIYHKRSLGGGEKIDWNLL